MTQATYVKDKFPDMWWCDPNNLADITMKLKQAYQTENRFHNQNYTIKNYSWEVCGVQMEKIIQQTINKPIIKPGLKFWQASNQAYHRLYQAQLNEISEKDRLIYALDVENRKKQIAIEEMRRDSLNHHRNGEGIAGKLKQLKRRLFS